MGAVLGAKFGTVLGDRISAGSSSENDLEVDGVFQLFLMQGALHNTITYFMLCSRVKKKQAAKRQARKPTGTRASTPKRLLAYANSLYNSMRIVYTLQTQTRLCLPS